MRGVGCLCGDGFEWGQARLWWWWVGRWRQISGPRPDQPDRARPRTALQPQTRIQRSSTARNYPHHSASPKKSLHPIAKRTNFTLTTFIRTESLHLQPATSPASPGCRATPLVSFSGCSLGRNHVMAGLQQERGALHSSQKAKGSETDIYAGRSDLIDSDVRGRSDREPGGGETIRAAVRERSTRGGRAEGVGYETEKRAQQTKCQRPAS